MNTFLGIEHFGGRVVYIIWTYKIFSWLNTIVSLKSVSLSWSANYFRWTYSVKRSSFFQTWQNAYVFRKLFIFGWTLQSSLRSFFDRRSFQVSQRWSVSFNQCPPSLSRLVIVDQGLCPQHRVSISRKHGK